MKNRKDKRNLSSKVTKNEKKETSKDSNQIIEEEIEDLTDQKKSSNKISPVSKLGPLPDLKKSSNNSTIEPAKQENSNENPRRASKYKNRPFNNLKKGNLSSNIFDESSKK